MMITKAVLVMMISLIFSIILGIVLIPFLKKLKFGQRLSEYLEGTHKEKQGTPTMGGLIFIIPVIIVMIFMCIYNGKISSSLIIVLITFLSYFLIGFIDDFISSMQNSLNNKKVIGIKREPTPATIKKGTKDIIKTQIIVNSQSTSKSREQTLLNSLSNSYKSISDDNELIPKEIKNASMKNIDL